VPAALPAVVPEELLTVQGVVPAAESLPLGQVFPVLEGLRTVRAAEAFPVSAVVPEAEAVQQKISSLVQEGLRTVPAVSVLQIPVVWIRQRPELLVQVPV